MEDAVEEISEAERVRALIVARRAEARRVEADMVEENLTRAGVCADNREYKAAVPGLELAIQRLEFTSPELHSYIRKMELAHFDRRVELIPRAPEVARPVELPVETPAPVVPPPAKKCHREDAIVTFRAVRTMMDVLGSRLGADENQPEVEEPAPTQKPRPDTPWLPRAVDVMPSTRPVWEDFSKKINDIAESDGELW